MSLSTYKWRRCSAKRWDRTMISKEREKKNRWMTESWSQKEREKERKAGRKSEKEKKRERKRERQRERKTKRERVRENKSETASYRLREIEQWSIGIIKSRFFFIKKLEDSEKARKTNFCWKPAESSNHKLSFLSVEQIVLISGIWEVKLRCASNNRLDLNRNLMRL